MSTRRRLRAVLSAVWGEDGRCDRRPTVAGVTKQHAAADPAVTDLMKGWTMLTQADRESFDNNGFLVVKGALSEREVEALAAAGEHLDAHSEDYWDARGQERNLLAVDPDNFLPLLTHPVTLPLVAQLMGPRLQLHTSQFLWRHPDSVSADSPHANGIDASKLGWHRDIAEMTSVIGPGVMPRVEIKCMFYVSDCDKPGYGQTWVAAGSHKWQPGDSGAYQGPEAKARIVDEGRAVEAMLKAGDCLLFENRCFHSVGVNLSNSVRKSFVVGYSYRWMRPDDYNTQDEEFLSKYCNPLERELMVMNGMNIGNDGVWKAGGDPTLLEEIFFAHHGHKTAATF